ncbi:MAG: helix-turn-helix transcriptional regulator [Ruminococcus sp.]
MSVKLGHSLAKLRKDCELTQKQVADILHLERSTYAYYERGTTEPDLKTLTKLARIYNVPLDYFLPINDGIRTSIADPELADKPAKDRGTEDFKIYNLSKEEQDILILYRALDSDKKEKFKSLAREMNKN